MKNYSIPDSSSLESNIKYKHSLGNEDRSFDTAWSEICGYSRENPSPDELLTQDTRLYITKVLSVNSINTLIKKNKTYLSAMYNVPVPRSLELINAPVFDCTNLMPSVGGGNEDNTTIMCT